MNFNQLTKKQVEIIMASGEKVTFYPSMMATFWLAEKYGDIGTAWTKLLTEYFRIAEGVKEVENYSKLFTNDFFKIIKDFSYALQLKPGLKVDYDWILYQDEVDLASICKAIVECYGISFEEKKEDLKENFQKAD